LKNLLNYIFLDSFNEHNRNERFDKKAVFVLIASTCSVLIIEYFASLSYLTDTLNNLGLTSLSQGINELALDLGNYRLFSLIYWAITIFSCYFILPVLIIKLIFKEPLSNYGLKLSKITKGYKVYLLFLVFMLPLIIWMSTTDSFQSKYPFYDPSDEDLWPNFIIWECFYICQFFALEFFFRGFMVHGLKHRFGFNSIFIMIIPYCMIHFQKPMPEAFAAIFAGLILGALSLRSKSIWLGFLLHCSVAITMDLSALFQKGYFG
jgi:membrane protease YdiL (CAAX protease family)